MNQPEILDEEIKQQKQRSRTLIFLETLLLLGYTILIFVAAYVFYIEFFRSGAILEEFILILFSGLNLSYVWLGRKYSKELDKNLGRVVEHGFFMKLMSFISLLFGLFLILISFVIPWLNNIWTAKIGAILEFVPFFFLGLGQVCYSILIKKNII